MNKKIMLLIIAALLIAVSIIGKFVSIGHLSTLGWQSSSYPFWLFAIAWGLLYCAFLYYKKLLPRQHPVLWLVGLIPIIYGIYVEVMMGGAV